MDDESEIFSHFCSSINNFPYWKETTIHERKVRILVNYEDVYQKIKLLGEGAFGKVYLVKEIRNNEFYALKEINISGSKGIDDFIKECRIMQYMVKRGVDVPKIYDYFFYAEAENLKAIIKQEYIKGMDLFYIINYLRDKNLTLSDAHLLRFSYWLFHNVNLIHKSGYIHRDIKVENIMVDFERKKIFLLDFGLTVSRRKKKIYSAGTPYFLSPELCLNRRRSLSRSNVRFLDKSDVWSSGIVLFLLAYKKLPWNDNFSLETLKDEIISSEPKDFEEIKDQTKIINRIILLALEKNKRKRLNAEDILKEIKNYL